jgi:hypothetical protein
MAILSSSDLTKDLPGIGDMPGGLCFLLFICCAGDWTQGLTHTRQGLYYLNFHDPALLFLFGFWSRVSLIHDRSAFAF